MPRTIWKGHISFGLVEIPVGLYSATKGESGLSFSLLDRRDLSPIGYRKVNKRSGEEVGADDIVKGYEVDEDRFVTLTDEELAAANPKASRTIDIVAFCDAGEVDPRYFSKPYYLAPTRRGSKAYALLREALRRTNKVGVAKVVMRSKQYLAAVYPFGSMLLLEVLRYEHELRAPEELEVPGEDLAELGVRDKEVDLAERLVVELTDPFDPAAFKDEYRDDVLALIHRKADEGEAATVAKPTEEAEEAGRVVDLMALLKQSVERVKPAAKAKEPKEGKTRERTSRA